MISETARKIVSGILTAIIILIALLLCMAFGYMPPDPPIPESGVEVSLGNSDMGFGDAETPDKHSRKTLQCLVAQVGVFEELLLVLVGDAIGQADAVVGERKGGDDGVGLALETEKIGLAEQPTLIDKTILGEELVKVALTTTKRTTLGESLFRGTYKFALCQQLLYGHNAVQVFRKSETTCASWR